MCDCVLCSKPRLVKNERLQNSDHVTCKPKLLLYQDILTLVMSC